MPDKDYVSKRELITMKANEEYRCIEIQIHDDALAEPDEDFTVMLMEEDDENLVLEGYDAMTRVTIIDDDSAGVIGFRDERVTVMPKGNGGSGVVEIIIKRSRGADGDVSCVWNTSLDPHKLKLRQAAEMDFDF